MIEILFILSSIFFVFPSQTNIYLYRSTDLDKVEDGNATEYRLDGVLTYAANLHYARMVSTESNYNNESVIIETYFDSNGDPARQTNGHYALQKYYINGLNTSTIYLDINLQRMMNTSGYCIVSEEYENNMVVMEWYKDLEGCPVANTQGVFGRKNYYENGRNTIVTYLDVDGTPKKTKSGYAILKRTFYEEEPWIGKSESEFYFDEKEQPIALSLGQYGVHKEYDEFGRNDVLTYLDADGNLIETKQGYTTVKRTFFPDDTVRTEMYFDRNGNPVALSLGQYGIIKENGHITFLDAEGKYQFNLRNWLYANPVSVILIALLVVVASTVLGKKENCILLITYIVFAVYMTLMDRSEGNVNAKAELFWSYKQFFSSSSLRLEILNNIWLFIPLGAILSKVCPSVYSLLILVLFSIFIESIQHFTDLGLCELDDVISNGLGSVLGFGFTYTLKPFLMKLKGDRELNI